MADRLSYVHGDFNDPKLYGKLKKALKGSHAATFYLEVPPSLFVIVAQHLYNADLLHGRCALSSRSRSVRAMKLPSI